MEDRNSLEAYRDRVQRELVSRRLRLEQLERRIAELTFHVQSPFAGKRCIPGADILAYSKQASAMRQSLQQLLEQREEAHTEIRAAEERLHLALDELRQLENQSSNDVAN